ncbi:MAG: InlB B-repeat-containing protein [Treponema sp.]|nr:InlB B-repeat-containing protein [Treponema sp.]
MRTMVKAVVIFMIMFGIVCFFPSCTDSSDDDSSTSSTQSTSSSSSSASSGTTADSSHCTVTFESIDGAVIATQKVERGKTAVSLSGSSVPSRSGYTFAGWAYKKGNVSRSFNFNTPINENITLYAIWIKKSNGSAGSGSGSTSGNAANQTEKEFISLEYAKRAGGVENQNDNSWSTWTKNADKVEVTQKKTDNGYEVTVTYNSSSMAGNKSSNEDMASKYGTAIWMVTTTNFPGGADGVTVSYNGSEYPVSDFFFGGAPEVSSSAYHDWWLLKGGEDGNEEGKNYDRNGKSTTLTFKQAGKDDTEVVLKFVDTAD